jgi:hypothetical protein
MVQKKDDTSKVNTEVEITPEEEAKLNRELGFTEGATAALVRRDGGSLFSDQDLRDIVDFEDYLAEYAEEMAASEDFIGSGSQVLIKDEWMRLIGTPLAIIQWNFTDSQEFDSWFVWVEVIDQHNARYAFSSGHKFGIRDQLYERSAKTGQFNHVIVRKGLVDADWTWTDPETGKDRVIHVPTLPR